MKKILTTLILSSLILFFINTVFAQETATSNSVTTKVGNPAGGTLVIPPAPADILDLGNQIKDTFGVDFQSPFFKDQSNYRLLAWAWEALWTAQYYAPNYLPLIHKKYTLVHVFAVNDTGHRSGDNIYFGLHNGEPLKSSKEFFMQNFIHEMGHIVHGTRGDLTYDSDIKKAVDIDGYLTSYSAGAYDSPSAICQSVSLKNAGRSSTQLDEDFAESTAYYINKTVNEQSYSNSECPPSAAQMAKNPIYDGAHSAHLAIMQKILGSSTTIATTPTPVVSSKIVVIDPGHGDPDPDELESKSPEGKLNLVVSRKVRDYLTQQGVTAKLTHNGNIPITGHYEGLRERIRIINSLGGAFFVAVHFDSGNYPGRQSGPEALYNISRSFSDQNKQIADLVSSSISSRTGYSQTGVIGAPVSIDDTAIDGLPFQILGPKGALTDKTKPESVILEPTNIPGIIEEFFSQGRSYDLILADSDLVDKIAKGYCDGILKYVKGDRSLTCK